jgi:hypothetical protein
MPRQCHDKPCSLIEIRITIFTLSDILDTFRQQHFQIRNEAEQQDPSKKKKGPQKGVLAHTMLP